MHSQTHGHHHDRGVKAALRYLKLLPLMWRSELNSAVVREMAIHPGETVVDLGAGPGAASAEAARLGAKVIAVDPMPLMRTVLEFRRRIAPGGSGISVRSGAAEALPVEDASVDALWTVNTLHHWTDLEQASHELVRVLKPGGRLLLLDEDAKNPEHPEHEHFRQRSRFHFDDVSPEALAAKLKSAGFTKSEGRRTHFAGLPVLIVRATR